MRISSETRKVLVTGMAVMMVCVTSGVTIRWSLSNIDTSGFQPAPIQTPQDVENSIQLVKTSTLIPAGEKALILGKLRQQLNGLSGQRPGSDSGRRYAR